MEFNELQNRPESNLQADQERKSAVSDSDNGAVEDPNAGLTAAETLIESISSALLTPGRPKPHVHFNFDDHWPNDEVNRAQGHHSESVHADDLTEDESSSFSRRQWLVLVVFGFAEFFSAVVVSLQAPFYPAEAEKKGVTPTEYGLVFGVFELTVFFVSFVYGKYMDVLGPKLIFNLGLLTTGSCSILFGFLDRIDDRTTFLALSMVTRIVEALGDAAFITASFTIIASEFPRSVATTFAAMETFFGFGLICGPMIGGALFQVGGYTLPFVLAGSLLLLSAVLTYFVLPNSQDKGIDLQETSARGLISILRIPSVALAAFTILAGAMSIGFLSATLEPHIRMFGLSPILTGLVFVISGGTYAVSAPFWGCLCDQNSNPKYLTLIGSLLIICGFLIIGPAPFLPIDTTLWLTGIGLAMHGIGLGATLVVAFIEPLKMAIKHGFPDNVATYGLVSGLWTSFFALGNFIGPSISGILFDTVGFKNGSLFVGGFQLVVLVLVIPFLLCPAKVRGSKRTLKGSESSSQETVPLLS